MRINHVEKARKAPGNCSRCSKAISAGDSYYWFKFRFGSKRVYCGLHRPKRSETTQSDKLSTLYGIQEGLEDSLNASDLGDLDNVADALDSAASEAREVAEEYRNSASNIEQAFPNGSPTIDQCNESADACDSWADELEQAAQDVRGFTSEEFSNEEEESDLVQQGIDRASDAIGELQL